MCAVVGTVHTETEATFFNIGLASSANPSLVREEVRDGFLVGDHTNSHPVLAKESLAGQRNEIVQAAVRQHQVGGSWPCVFRAPCV